MGNTSASLNKIGNQLDTALKSGEAQFSQMTSPANPLECLQSGRRVSLQSKTSGKYLRCLPDGNLDSLGILDGYSNFLVNSVGPNRFTLKNCAYNNYVSLTGSCSCEGREVLGNNPFIITPLICVNFQIRIHSRGR